MSTILFLLSTMQVAHGRATVYWPGDGHCGTTKATGRRFTSEDSHIAHRSLPLYTSGILCNLRTKLCTRTNVEDRGPFGAVFPCGKERHLDVGARQIRWMKRCYWYQVQTRLKPGWEYRGTFDLTKPVADAIKHRAFDRVVFVYSKSRAEI